jgi:hypothetical protein
VKTKVIASECCKYKGTGIREKQKKLIKKKKQTILHPFFIVRTPLHYISNHPGAPKPLGR